MSLYQFSFPFLRIARHPYYEVSNVEYCRLADANCIEHKSERNGMIRTSFLFSYWLFWFMIMVGLPLDNFVCHGCDYGPAAHVAVRSAAPTLLPARYEVRAICVPTEL